MINMNIYLVDMEEDDENKQRVYIDFFNDGWLFSIDSPIEIKRMVNEDNHIECHFIEIGWYEFRKTIMKMRLKTILKLNIVILKGATNAFLRVGFNRYIPIELEYLGDVLSSPILERFEISTSNSFTTFYTEDELNDLKFFYKTSGLMVHFLINESPKKYWIEFNKEPLYHYLHSGIIPILDREYLRYTERERFKANFNTLIHSERPDDLSDHDVTPIMGYKIDDNFCFICVSGRGMVLPMEFMEKFELLPGGYSEI